MKKINLGLKASSTQEQVKNRLSYHPDVFEFYTDETDFSKEGLKRLVAAILEVKDAGIKKIILHHPMKYENEYTELVAPKNEFKKLNYFIDFSTDKLLQLSFDYDLQTLVHGSYSRHTNAMISLYPSLFQAKKVVYQRIDHFAAIGKQNIMFENSFSPLFCFGEIAEEEFILQKNYRLAFDISHCFIKVQADNTRLLASLNHLKPNIVHYHLVDSLGQTHDSLKLGKGLIDWQSVLPFLNENASNIFEINLADKNSAIEQFESYQYLIRIYSRLSKRA